MTKSLKTKVKEVKVKKKPGRKPKKKPYFGMDVQDAIVRYNTNPDNFPLRNKIYRDEIHKAAPSPDRWKIRSKFFPGLAKAMATQWGNFALNTLAA